MSAPQTNIEKQERRHRPALGGMTIAVGFAALLFVGWILWVFAAGNTPGESDAERVVPGAEAVETQEGPVAGEGTTVTE